MSLSILLRASANILPPGTYTMSDPQSWNSIQHDIWPEALLYSDGVGDSPWQCDPLVSRNTIWRLPTEGTANKSGQRHYFPWGQGTTKDASLWPSRRYHGPRSQECQAEMVPLTFTTCDPPEDFMGPQACLRSVRGPSPKGSHFCKGSSEAQATDISRTLWTSCV